MTPNLETRVSEEHLKASASLSDGLIDVLCYNKLSEEKASVSLFGPDGAARQGNSS